MEPSIFKDKTLLITGGTGSFGNTVLKHFLTGDIGEIRIFSRDEKKQDDMRHEYQKQYPELAGKLKFYIGDVREPASVKSAMRGVDYLFHAAALKQVPSCEFFPMEAVRTNIIGTDNVLTAAIAAGVKKVVCLSTDKAAYPINAMGISKAMMEKVIGAKARTVQADRTTICCTRYGNVMASRGSVIPLFVDQIKAGKPITITDPEMCIRDRPAPACPPAPGPAPTVSSRRLPRKQMPRASGSRQVPRSADAGAGVFFVQHQADGAEHDGCDGHRGAHRAQNQPHHAENTAFTHNDHGSFSVICLNGIIPHSAASCNKKIRRPPRRGAGSRRSAAEFFDIGVQALADDLLRRLGALFLVHHGLLALQVFIHAEEVAHLAEDMAGQLGDVAVLVVHGVVEGDGDDLLVQLALVPHGDDTCLLYTSRCV